MGWEWTVETFKALIAAAIIWIATYTKKKIIPTIRSFKRILDVSSRVDKIESEIVIISGRQMALMYCDVKPIFILNEKGEVKFVNPEWLEMTGIGSEKDAMGFGYLKAIPEEDREMMIEQSEFSIKHPGCFSGEVRFQHVNTKEIIIAYCRSEVINNKEILVETVGILNVKN